jgi:hypothetical protein
MPYSRGIQDRNDFEHVPKQDLVEEVGVAFFQAVEVDVFLEADMFAPQLSQATLTVVSVQEIWRNSRRCVRHGTQGENSGDGHGESVGTKRG